MKELLFLKKYFSKYTVRFSLGVLFVGLANVFKIWQPRVIRDALDTVVSTVNGYKSTGGLAAHPEAMSELSLKIAKFGGMVIVLALCMGVFMYFMRQTIIYMSRLIEYDLRKEIFAKLSTLDNGYFKKSSTGDLMSRAAEDVSKVRMFLGPAILYGVDMVFLFTLTISSMLAVSPTLTFWTLAPLPILSVSIYYISQVISKRSTAIQAQLSTLTSTAQEVYSGIRVVKGYGREDSMVRWFDEQSTEFQRRTMRLVQVESVFHPLMVLLIGASTIITVYVGGLQVAAGEITAGNIAEFVIYVNMLTWPVTALGWISSLTMQAAASQKRINAVLAQQSAITNPADGGWKPADGHIKGDIRFENLQFTYPDTGIIALKDINIHIKAGQKVAIVGRTGSGKTTLADLLVRLYDPTEGRVLVDDHDLRAMNISTLRQAIGYVPQDGFLFSDTVFHNISFGNPDLSLEDAQDWAKKAAIHDEILGLSDGYQTLIGERGVTLSGGQKQRIGIARMFAKNPDIILLDDCLSAIDANTEDKINTYLSDEMGKRTAIVITHRIHRSIAYDQIFVLEEGRLVQSGTHEELMQQGGYYQELIERQQQ